MNANDNAGNNIFLVGRYFGAHERINLNRSMQQCCKCAQFMKQIWLKINNYHINKPGFHYKNSCEDIMNDTY